MSHHITTKIQCQTCILSTVTSILDKITTTPAIKLKAMRRSLHILETHAYPDIPPIDYASDIIHALEDETGISDFYREEKEISNIQAQKLCPFLKSQLQKEEDPYQRFHQAILIAIAGNLIDFGTSTHQINLNQLEPAVNNVLNSSPIIDHTGQLLEEIKHSTSILYLCDNAGEIVFDRILLQEIRRLLPQKSTITAVVKDGPISNDATLEDAEAVNLKDTVDNIVTTGSADLGVHSTRSSKQFRQLLQTADLVIAKGQSNLESLWDNTQLRSKPTCFLLITKCAIIAAALKVPLYSPVILVSKQTGKV